MAQATLKVRGMSCNHCVHAVTTALEAAPGVTRAQVDLQQGRAVIDYDESRVTPRELASVVMDEGYEAEETT
jgi:copper ion binding protein